MSRLTVSLFLLLLTAATQADLAEQLEICAAMEEAESRLACFDAIGRSKPATAPQVREAVQTAAEPEPAPEPAPNIPAPSATPAADEFGMDSMTAREREELDRQQIEDERLAKADRKQAEKERKALEKEQRRAEKEARKREREKSVVATITGVTEHHDGRFSVKLDNGQVWRETQGSKVGIPEAGARVELKHGRFGGYRMNIDGLYRTAWVKRTK